LSASARICTTNLVLLVSSDREERTVAEHHVTRWPGKPTSGRYVYRYKAGGWGWQCDLHEISVAAYHSFPTHAQALENALIHAAKCPERNAR